MATLPRSAPVSLPSSSSPFPPAPPALPVLQSAFPSSPASVSPDAPASSGLDSSSALQQQYHSPSLSSNSRSSCASERASGSWARPLRDNGLASPPASQVRQKDASRTSSTLLSLATVALDKTQLAWANLSEPVVRPRLSSSALARLSRSSALLARSDSQASVLQQGSPTRSVTSQPSPTAAGNADPGLPTSPLTQDPPSRRYSETDDKLPRPVKLMSANMHQTSSRLLRMTEDDRPFTRVSALKRQRPTALETTPVLDGEAEMRRAGGSGERRKRKEKRERLPQPPNGLARCGGFSR